MRAGSILTGSTTASTGTQEGLAGGVWPWLVAAAVIAAFSVWALGYPQWAGRVSRRLRRRQQPPRVGLDLRQPEPPQQPPPLPEVAAAPPAERLEQPRRRPAASGRPR